MLWNVWKLLSVTVKNFRIICVCLLDKGGLYKIYNGNLLFHGCIPLNEDGSLKEMQIYGKTYKGT